MHIKNNNIQKINFIIIMIDFFFIRYYKSNPLPLSFDEICLLCLARLPSLDSVTYFFLEDFTLVTSLAAASTHKIYKIEIL